MTTNKNYRWLIRHPQAPLYGACFFFALMALTVKLLTDPRASAHPLPSIQVAFFRSFLCLLMMIPSLRSQEKSSFILSKPLFLRSLAGGLAMICYFQAIQRLSLPTAVLLNYTSPLWASLFAWVCLRERLPIAIGVAYPVALGGVLLVVGAPGAVDDVGGYLLGLFSAVLAGAAYTALRGLRQTHPTVVVAGLCAVTSLLTLPFCLANFTLPGVREWILLWVCGGSSALAQLLLTLGYRWSTTSTASTVGMATVAATWGLSWVILGEQLSPPQMLGMALLLTATSQAARGSLLNRFLESLLRGPRTA